MSKTVICLMGPTASGKTALACDLVKQGRCEIVSVDSAMIYREMNIGTAKPDQSVLAQAPHQLIDILDPIDSWSAAEFVKAAQRCIADIQQREKIPLLVGGTMLYFRALQQGLSSLPEADPSVRDELLQQAEAQGWPAMHQWLAKIDPVTAARLHPHDAQRIQRALEVYRVTGQPLSALLQEEDVASPFDFKNVLLMPTERSWLHERIADRFIQMMHDGFVDEVAALLAKWPLTFAHPALRCVGYRQVAEYLQGDLTKDALNEKGIAATRQLAKRQLTWLRHWPSGNVFPPDHSQVKLQINNFLAKYIE